MIRDNREYRTIPLVLEKRDEKDGEEAPKEDFSVKGYASTFEPYVLFEDEDGTQYSEQIDAKAFDEADMTDVVFLYNHEGMVFARQKNGTLKLSIDDHGLLAEADLGRTTQSRELFEAINSGLVDQMSFAFTVADDDYDNKTHTRTIHRIGKVYDVSAVSIPANPGTDIAAVSARSWLNGVIEAEKTERLERQKKLNVLKAKFNYLKEV